MPRRNKNKIATVFSDPEVQKIYEKCHDDMDKLMDAPLHWSGDIMGRSRRPINNLSANINTFLSMLDRIPESELKSVYTHVDLFYQEIAFVYSIAGEESQSKMWYEKCLEFLNSAPPNIDVNESKLDVTTSLLSDVILLRDKDEAKKYLKMSNELYNICRAAEIKAKENDQEQKPAQPPQRNGKRFKKPSCSLLDRHHLNLIEAYHDYYSNIDKNSDKRVHYGIMAKKYEAKYWRCDRPAAWIADIVGFAIECRELGAGKQCHHLLMAAKSMFNKRKHNLKGDPDNPLHYDEEFLESFIDIELANYYLWVLEIPTFERPKLGGKLVNYKSLIEFEGFNIPTSSDALDLQVERMSIDEINQQVEKVKKLIGNIEKRDLQWDMFSFLDFKDTVRKLMQVVMTINIHTKPKK